MNSFRQEVATSGPPPPMTPWLRCARGHRARRASYLSLARDGLRCISQTSRDSHPVSVSVSVPPKRLSQFSALSTVVSSCRCDMIAKLQAWGHDIPAQECLKVLSSSTFLVPKLASSSTLNASTSHHRLPASYLPCFFKDSRFTTNLCPPSSCSSLFTFLFSARSFQAACLVFY